MQPASRPGASSTTRPGCSGGASRATERAARFRPGRRRSCRTSSPTRPGRGCSPPGCRCHSAAGPRMNPPPGLHDLDGSRQAVLDFPGVPEGSRPVSMLPSNVVLPRAFSLDHGGVGLVVDLQHLCTGGDEVVCYRQRCCRICALCRMMPCALSSSTMCCSCCQASGGSAAATAWPGPATGSPIEVECPPHSIRAQA